MFSASPRRKRRLRSITERTHEIQNDLAWPCAACYGHIITITAEAQEHSAPLADHRWRRPLWRVDGFPLRAFFDLGEGSRRSLRIRRSWIECAQITDGTVVRTRLKPACSESRFRIGIR
jgi:hypothetical protein